MAVLTGRDRREISWEEFGRLSRDLAMRLHQRGPEVIVGVARGGAILGCTLSFLLGIDYYPIRLKKIGGSTRVVVAPSRELRGRRVALVDDLSESGDTFRIAQHELNLVGAETVLTVALVRRIPGYTPDLWALDVSGKVRFPWAAEQIIGGELRKRL